MNAMQCPCRNHQQNNKKLTFENCCQLIIQQQKPADTAEALMRSRYSAYATKNAQYILATYSAQSAKQQSLADIQQWANSCQWVNLMIHPQHKINNDKSSHTNNTVEFSAFYIENKQLCMIRERSRFVIENNQWLYHDGEIIENMVCSKVKRNELCPCQSNKKFKVCCQRYM